jgi:hypothetical protein
MRFGGHEGGSSPGDEVVHGITWLSVFWSSRGTLYAKGLGNSA